MKHATYIGNEERLKGKTALVIDDSESKTKGVLAQFDDRQLPEAFNWWSFYSYEFAYDDIEEEK